MDTEKTLIMSKSLKDSKQTTGDMSAVITAETLRKAWALGGGLRATSSGGCALPKPLSLRGVGAVL